MRKYVIELEGAYTDKFPGASLTEYIKNAFIGPAAWDKEQSRLVVTMWDRKSRDELFKRLQQSPLKPASAEMYVQCALTKH
jgi:hypothetical protein